MGEVFAGVLLGADALLGAVWPSAQTYLFPPDIVPLLSAIAQVGLVFYLFVVGMEFDPASLRGRDWSGGLHLKRERRASHSRSGS